MELKKLLFFFLRLQLSSDRIPHRKTTYPDGEIRLLVSKPLVKNELLEFHDCMSGPDSILN